MMTITLKNIPDELHRRLKERAASHHRSLNSEIIAALEMLTRNEPFDAQSYLERVRRLRPAGHERLTLEDFQRSRDEGRP